MARGVSGRASAGPRGGYRKLPRSRHGEGLRTTTRILRHITMNSHQANSALYAAFGYVGGRQARTGGLGCQQQGLAVQWRLLLRRHARGRVEQGPLGASGERRARAEVQEAVARDHDPLAELLLAVEAADEHEASERNLRRRRGVVSSCGSPTPSIKQIKRGLQRSASLWRKG